MWLTPIILATQEDGSSKPTQGNSLQDPMLKKPFTYTQKKGWWNGSRCSPQVQTLVPEKKK
jgi:hypothetical protein